MKSYRELKIWNESMNLVSEVYDLCKTFPTDEKFNLSGQIRRCAVSIPSNIAEGAGRNSDKEFIHFLGVAAGSSYELGTQIEIARNVGYLDDVNSAELLDKLDHIQKMIYKFQLRIKKDLTK